MAKVFLTGLKVFARHGMTAAENQAGRHFMLDIELEYEPSADAKDDLSVSIDYSQIAEICTRVLVANTFRTLEFAAKTLMFELQNAFPNAPRGIVRLAKLHPPIEGIVEAAGVEISWP